MSKLEEGLNVFTFNLYGCHESLVLGFRPTEIQIQRIYMGTMHFEGNTVQGMHVWRERVRNEPSVCSHVAGTSNLLGKLVDWLIQLASVNHEYFITRFRIEVNMLKLRDVKMMIMFML